MPEKRIKVAVQNAGRLTDHSLDLLRRCGLKYTKGRDQLICFGENMPVDVMLVRDDDIPSLVRDDVCDLGIVGMNVVKEKTLSVINGNPLPRYKSSSLLDFGHCRLSIAAQQGVAYHSTSTLSGSRIATSYPHILTAWLSERRVDAEVVTFSGAVEVAPRLGKADFICDLVSSGTTLAANHLYEVETVFESRAALIQTPVPVPDEKADWIARLLQRVEGVLQVRESKYIMLHAPRSALAEITSLLPASEAATVMQLEGRPDKVALHVFCRENVFWETLEALKSAGASSVLVLPVEKMLA